MTQHLSAKIATYNKIKDLDYDVAVLPKQKVRAAGYNANPFVINSKAKQEQAQAAWEVIKFFTSNEKVQKLWADNGKGVPILKKAVYDSFVNSSDKPKNRKAFIEPLENNYARPMDLNKCWNEWRVALTDALELAWLGQSSAKEAVRKAHRDVQKILDNAYK